MHKMIMKSSPGIHIQCRKYLLLCHYWC